jgi:2-polyprenyl-3-methyl-5-hydroxy-6-metoxy-1,4-benzoquinol methylase
MIVKLPFSPNNVLAARIPDWNPEKAIHRRCPVCESGSPQLILERPDKFVVSRYSICGMIYLADIPYQEEIIKFYKNYGNFKRFQRPKKDYSWLKLKWIKLIARQNFYISILEFTGGINGQNICEIGCSYGWFLRLLASKGGQVFGVEIDEEALYFLKENGIHATPIIDTSFEYDIVCLLQLLEHLTNPSEILSIVSKVLNKDGRVLISVPNAGEYTKVGSAWVGFRVDLEHYNYFDLQSLSKLLLNHGLSIEHFWEHAQPAIRGEINTKNNITNPFKKGWMGIRNIIGGLLSENSSQKGSFVLTVVARKF